MSNVENVRQMYHQHQNKWYPKGVHYSKDHYSFENYTQMPISAIFWLLEKICPTIEREDIYILSFPVKTGIRDYGVSSLCNQ